MISLPLCLYFSVTEASIENRLLHLVTALQNIGVATERDTVL